MSDKKLTFPPDEHNLNFPLKIDTFSSQWTSANGILTVVDGNFEHTKVLIYFNCPQIEEKVKLTS